MTSNCLEAQNGTIPTNDSTWCSNTTAWLPPPTSSLLWNADEVCDQSALWLASSLRDVQISVNDETNYGNINQPIALDFLIYYVWTVLPTNVTCCPSAGQITDYYANNGNASLFTELYDFSQTDECSSHVCPKLEWQGDPDVSGQGMMASYFIEAGLATIYFTVLTISGLDFFQNSEARRRRMNLVSRGFANSVTTFLYGSLVFSGAMVVAAVVRYTNMARHPNDSYSIYGLLGSVYMAAFSVFPSLMLQAVSDHTRRRWVEFILWFGIITLSIVVEVQYRHAYKHMAFDTAEQVAPVAVDAYWYYYCDDDHLRGVLRGLTTAAHIILGLNVIWFFSELSRYLWRKCDGRLDRQRVQLSSRWRVPGSVRIIAQTLNGLVCCIFMWTLLVVFFIYRRNISQRAGGSDQDTQWTFGQALAIGQWVPVAIDYYNSCREEDARGAPYQGLKDVEAERENDPHQVMGLSKQAGSYVLRG